MLANRIAARYPRLKDDLRVARLPYSPNVFVKKGLQVALIYSSLFLILFFLLFDKKELPLIFLLPIYLIMLFIFFMYHMVTIKARIRKRQREIDKEVTFIGRYLLVKLYSGRPLLNALIETSSGRGIAAGYIKEIVNDIGTGSTIEEALNNGMVFSPSDKLRKILFHINNALQLGIDVTTPLENVLDEITKEEELEIKKYGKKLNTLVIFFMLVAVILPSLGTSMFIVVASLLSFPVDFTVLSLLLVFIIVLQFMFIILFKGIRPLVNL